ncbi:alpha/beta fold hydrolase [Leptospira semungkisensis]|uniref:Alpha/beta fold hydrolase n=1 Tax=Leptospira semungkisensis TaxID=2484985 RepID=A0A4R9FYD0_9LEPT|nr:haloalkane dehalogenase [Leptospira semungkisensis]TGK03894.1 alpha/beta fold hydrolase [Leptospira semungkisensis]
MQTFLETPTGSFANLTDYPFSPNYIQLKEFKMHYVDEGPKDAQETILLLHGEPSWSYLYRKMVPPLAMKGYRVIAPDLIGFGKSDKPTDANIFTYENHINWLKEFIVALDLKRITLFCQDWGGLLGLRAVADLDSRFSRVCASNTFLPTGDIPPKEGFLKWLSFSQEVSKLPIGKIIQNGCVTKLSAEVVKAYDSPFPDESYKVAARKFPTLVPISSDNPESEKNRQAWLFYKNWKKPFITMFSDSDPITKGGDIFFRRMIPGAKGQKHTTIEGAGHFLQEEKGELLADLLSQFIESNPS